MKQIIISLLVIVAVVTLIVISFTITQVNQEEQRLKSDIQYRSTLLAESLRETVEPNFINRSEANLKNVVEKFTDKERFGGIGIFDNKGQAITVSSNIPEATFEAQMVATSAMDSDRASSNFINAAGKRLYVLAIPLHEQNSVVGSLIVIQNANYIPERINEIWKNNLIRLIIQAFLITAAILLILRWIIYAPIKNIVESLRMTRAGVDKGKFKGFTGSFLFRPLIN